LKARPDSGCRRFYITDLIPGIDSSQTYLIPGIDGSDVAMESVGWIGPNQGVDLYIGAVPNFFNIPLKVHKREKFFSSDFEFFTILYLVKLKY